jgi:hypothetical protein
MKTFKQLREAVSKKDAESDELKPRAKGELDFANAHTQHDTAYPAKNTDNVLNAKSIGQTKHQPNNGDRGVIKQGTSDLADKSGFKGQQSKTRANSANANGDKVPVRGPSSAQAYAEEVFSDRSTITESSEGEDIFEIELENGDVVEVNEETLDIIAETYARLNPENQELFRDMINQSADSFSTIMDFVASNVEVE